MLLIFLEWLNFYFPGAMLGLNMAVNSLIRSVSPTVGGFLLKSYGFQSFGYLGFVMLTISTIILFIKLRQWFFRGYF